MDDQGVIFSLSLVNIPNGGASVPPLILPTYPQYHYSSTPLPPTYTVLSLVSTHNYLIGLTFFLGPDEVATVWWLQKLVCDINTIMALFQQSRRTINPFTYDYCGPH